MTIINRIAAFFGARPEPEQEPAKLSFWTDDPINRDDYEAVETDAIFWRYARATHLPYFNTPYPFTDIIESDEFDFDPVAFDAVKKPSRLAYYVWRKKKKPSESLP